MKLRLNPLVAALLGIAAPLLPVAAWATSYGQVLVDDPNGATTVTLQPGDSAAYAYDHSYGTTDGTLRVSVAGNRIVADGVSVQTLNDMTSAMGVEDGGGLDLRNSVASADGDHTRTLWVRGAGSNAKIVNSTLSILKNQGYLAEMSEGAHVTLEGGKLLAHDGTALMVRDQSVVSASNVVIEGTNTVFNDSSLTLDGVTHINSTGMLVATVGWGSSLVARNSTFRTQPSNMYGTVFLLYRDGSVDISGSSVQSAGRTLFQTAQRQANIHLTVRDASLINEGHHAVLIDQGTNSSVTLENVVIKTGGEALTVSDFDMFGSGGNRIDGKQLSIEVGVMGGGGVLVYGGDDRVSLSDSSVLTHGDRSPGLWVMGSSDLDLQNTRIVTEGQGSHGVAANGGGRVSLAGGSIETSGSKAAGLSANVVNGVGGGSFTVSGTAISTSGAGSAGIASMATESVPASINTFSLSNGASVDTQDGVGLLVAGGNQHRFTLDGVRVAARAAGQLAEGVLMRVQAYHYADDYPFMPPSSLPPDVPVGTVTLNASNASLTGDVLASAGVVDLRLERGSVLTGAVRQFDAGRINSLSIDSTSAWHVRGDSRLESLNNDGLVAFDAPAAPLTMPSSSPAALSASNGFKTLTVTHYAGSGTLVLNTRLGDDSSPTDRLVIDGGAATGNTGLRIVNAGGSGARTNIGIRVVETVNGGSTSASAFRLDPGSTGYRPGFGTLAANGYEYSLRRGGYGGVADDWYLSTSSAATPAPVSPTTPPAVTPDVGKSFQNVSPESGAYVGNQLAAMSLFSHSLHDRVAARRGVSDDDASGRRLWTRVLGRHDGGMRMTAGKVDIDTDSSLIQIGGDLLRAPLGGMGAVYAGVMAGYGDARTGSASTLRLGGQPSMRARASGKVSGYAAGVYATAYADDVERLGAFADAWIQYGRYDNRIGSDLGSASYRSGVWSASVEAGYAFKPFAATLVLADLAVEPHVQLTHARYRASGTSLQGTRMESGASGDTTLRAGVRVYAKPAPAAPQPAIRPFLEANWLHRAGTPSVRMGENRLDMTPARNALELKLGAETQVTRATQISVQAIGQLGSGQRGYGGSLNLSYRW